MVNDLIFPAKEIFSAYRAGLLQKHREHFESLSSSFDLVLKQAILNSVPLIERKALRKLWRASRSSLELAREGHLELAKVHIHVAKELLSNFLNRSEGALFSNSIFNAAAAYLEYRYGKFHEARRKVLAAMEADLILEEEYGCEFMEMHRLQLAHNFLRIDFKEGKVGRAFLVCGQIIAYAEGCLENILVHHSWRPDYLEQMPRSFRRSIITQISHDVALNLIQGTHSRLGWSAFVEALNLERYLEKQNLCHPSIRSWIIVKESFIRERREEYFKQLLAFLPERRSSASLVWYSTVVDLLNFCDKLDNSTARFVRSAILRDSLKWPNLPQVLSKQVKA